MQDNIKNQNYYNYYDQKKCGFTFDSSVQCEEFGLNSDGIHKFSNYTGIGDPPILSCFPYLINIFGFRNDELTTHQ